MLSQYLTAKFEIVIKNDSLYPKQKMPPDLPEGALLCLNADNTQFLRAIGNGIVKDMGLYEPQNSLNRAKMQ